jgi:uncharacterized membrane protein
MKFLKQYLLAGLLVWVPLIVTLFVLNWGFGIVEQIFSGLIIVLTKILPQAVHSFLLNLKNIPGLSAIVMFLILAFTGLFATNFIGQWWLKLTDRILGRIPIVKTIYSTVKQVSDALFSSNGNVFKEAVWVPYPEKDIFSIAFVTDQAKYHPEFGQEMVTVFLPTIPTPTAGFLLMVPVAHVKKMDMSVDEALKYVVSLGVSTKQENTTTPAVKIK